MKNIVFSLIVWAALATTASATPTLYNLTGQATADGLGTLAGSYVFDPTANLFYDWNLGAVYHSMPDFTSYLTVPQVWASPAPGIQFNFIVGMTDDNILTAELLDGKMPMYWIDGGTWGPATDTTWLNDSHAIRLNAADVYGAGRYVGPPGVWRDIIYNTSGLQNPTATVPEAPAGAVLMMGLLMGWFVFARPSRQKIG